MGHLREVAGALGLLVMLGATRYPHWGEKRKPTWIRSCFSEKN
jgi:hypothetical protein